MCDRSGGPADGADLAEEVGSRTGELLLGGLFSSSRLA